MDLKRKLSETRMRSAIKSRDGRALLDRMGDGNGYWLEAVLNEAGSAAAPALIDALRVTHDAREAGYVLTKLGHTGDAAALDAIRGAARDAVVDIRVQALWTLALHGGPDDADDIAGMIDDADPAISDAAVSALREISAQLEGRLQPKAAEALAAENARRDSAAIAAREAELNGPFTVSGAAATLIRICDEIDATYLAPIPADADGLRSALRADIERIGQGLNRQGGEDLMRQVAVLIANVSTHGSYVGREWTGIGGWMG